MKFNRLVQELNMYSVDPLVTALTEIVTAKTSDQDILNWFKTKYVKWFKSGDGDEEKQVYVRQHQKAEGDPSWADSTFDFVGFDNDATDEINHWIDYFVGLPEIDRNKIDRLTIQNVKERVAEWDAEMSSSVGRGKARGNIDSNVTKYRKDQATFEEFDEELKAGRDFKIFDSAINPKYAWIRHLSQRSLECESDDMGHCVGRGGYDVDRNPIVSLWDRRGNSYVTIELESDMQTVKQIKGVANAAPVEKYIPEIKKLVEKHGFKITNDGEEIGRAHV